MRRPIARDINQRRRAASNPVSNWGQQQVSSWLNFTPASLNPELWLDASDKTTITEVSNAVSQWNDKSSNARNMTQATGTRQPTTNTNTLNGLNVISFDGTSDYMDSPALSLSGRQYYLIVAVTNSNRRITYVSNQTTIGEATVVTNASTFRWVGYRYNTNMISTTTPADANTPYVISCDFNGSSSSMRVNGVQVVSGSVGTADLSGFRIGANPAPSFLAGLLAEVVIVSGFLSAQQIADWERYASLKWGIVF